MKFGMPKHLEKMCLETKFQPFLFRNDKDIHVQIDVNVSNLTFLRLYLLELIDCGPYGEYVFLIRLVQVLLGLLSPKIQIKNCANILCNTLLS